MADQEDWKREAFRRKVITQIEEELQKSSIQMNKTSVELENHVFNKAKSRDVYLALVARLILHVRNYKLLPLQNTTTTTTTNMADQEDWKREAFRRKVITLIEEELQKSSIQMNKSSVELENHVFNKAKSRDVYLALVARLILHVKNYNSQRNTQPIPQAIIGGMPQQQMGGGGMPAQMGAIQDPLQLSPGAYDINVDGGRID